MFGDQHRFCDLPCYGNQAVVAPNFERIAREGRVFEHCYSNSPVCVPARGSLLTGLLPVRHRAVTNDLPIDPACESIAHILGREGYDTAYIGKWHLGGVPRERFIPKEERLGFVGWKASECIHNYLDSYYDDENNVRHAIDGYEPDVQGDMAAEYVCGHTGKPWCLYLSFATPHDPYELVPARYKDLYKQKQTKRGNVRLPVCILGKTDYLPEGMYGDGAWLEEAYRGYYAHITAIDVQLGKLFAALEESGQAENTLVLYTSDHGDMLGSHGMHGKQVPYDESVRVPLLAWHPGGVLPGRESAIVSLVDLPVTAAGYVGARFTDPDGLDLSNLLLGDGNGREEAYIFEHVAAHQACDRDDDWNEWRGVRTRRYTYARSPECELALYDNVFDPLQLNNLIDDPCYQEVRVRLANKVTELAARYDRELPWDEFLRYYGLEEEWNKSQRYFGRHELSSGKR